jgi:uracil-DNA glycosylase
MINHEILNCKHISSINPPCSRYISASPLIMQPLNTQKVLLISRDPSNIADSSKILVGWENTFFRQHVLPIFFENYDKNRAKADIDYFAKYSEKFNYLVYWTHYSKCYPGKNKNGGHNQAKSFCSTQYLKREIEAASPDCIILMGKDVIEYLTNDSAINSIQRNGNDYLNINGRRIPIICLTHPSNSNNGCKNDPRYRFYETIQFIHQNINEYYS